MYIKFLKTHGITVKLEITSGAFLELIIENSTIIASLSSLRLGQGICKWLIGQNCESNIDVFGGKQTTTWDKFFTTFMVEQYLNSITSSSKPTKNQFSIIQNCIFSGYLLFKQNFSTFWWVANMNIHFCATWLAVDQTSFQRRPSLCWYLCLLCKRPYAHIHLQLY